MYSADADGRGHFFFFTFYFFFTFFFFLHTKIYGPNWSETQSQTAWVTPPPTHHDPIKIHIVYRLSPLFIFFLTLRCIPGGGGVLPIFFICICAARMPLFLTIFLSLAT